MKARVLFFFTLCMLTALTCQVSPVAAAANLVVTSVSGPAQASLNETVSITYTVKNKGDSASGGYQVGLYLSEDRTIDPAADRLLTKVSVANGLAPGQTRKRSTRIIVPNYHVKGLSGSYYYGAVVEPNSKASRNPVTIVRFHDNGDGTVSDFKTTLMWQKTDDGTERSWSDAGGYCNELGLGGHEDWWLPTMEELLTIVDYSRKAPAVSPDFDCRSADYWSSTGYAGYPAAAWSIYFSDGDTLNYGVDIELFARCVRGGP